MPTLFREDFVSFSDKRQIVKRQKNSVDDTNVFLSQNTDSPGCLLSNVAIIFILSMRLSFSLYRIPSSTSLAVMCVLTEAPRMLSMPKFARAMGDWRKYGNSPKQKTWTDAQPVCAYSWLVSRHRSPAPGTRDKVTW